MLAAVNGRPEIVTRWEDLHVGVQVVVAFAVSFVVMTLVHWTVLNQPVGRGLWYGLFWGAVLTVVIILATRAERARRIARDGRDPRGGTRGP